MNKTKTLNVAVCSVEKDGLGTAQITIAGMPEDVKVGDTVSVTIDIKQIKCPNCHWHTPDKRAFVGSNIVKCQHCPMSFAVREDT